MPVNLDKKMLNGFSKEVRSYLPSIREGIADFGENSNNSDSLSDVLRYIHTIKGASVLMGLSMLSQIASYVEELLEDIVSGNACLSPLQNQWLELTINQIDPYLEGLLSGDGESKEVISLIEKEYLRLKSGIENVELRENILHEDLKLKITSDELDVNKTPDSFEVTSSENTASELECLRNQDNVEPTDNVAQLEISDQSQRFSSENKLLDEDIDQPDQSQCQLETDAKHVTEDILSDFVSDEANHNFHASTQVFKNAVDIEKSSVRDSDLAQEGCSHDENGDQSLDLHDDTADIDPFNHDNQTQIEFNDRAVDVNRNQSEDLGNGDQCEQSEDRSKDQISVTESDSCDSYIESERDIFHYSINEPINESDLKNNDSTQDDVSVSHELENLIDEIDTGVRETYSFKEYSTEGIVPLLSANYSTRHLLFTIGQSYYAVAVTHILEIGHVPIITPLPNVPVWLKGITNLRGEILSVIDLGQFLEIGQSIQHDDKRLVVVKAERGDLATSLIVDQVNGFIQLESLKNNYSSLAFDQNITPYVDGIYELGGVILSTLNLEHFLQSSEVRRF